MLRTVEGTFRKGKIRLKETPTDVDEARILVTFLPNEVPLSDAEIEELRWRFEAWEADWHAPGMEAYNDL